MSEMINRVAKTLVEKMAEPSPRNETAEQIALYLARSVIEDMREPAKEMTHAGFCCGRDADPVEIWQTMIDEALK